MAKVGTERIDDTVYEIEVDSAGVFSVNVGDRDDLRAKTYDELIEKLRKDHKKRTAFTPIEVTLFNVRPVAKNSSRIWSDFPYERGHGQLDCILRGWSDRRRALLLTVDGKKMTCDDYQIREQVAKRFTQEETVLYEHLLADLEAAERAVEEFLKPRRIDVRELVDETKAAKLGAKA